MRKLPKVALMGAFVLTLSVSCSSFINKSANSFTKISSADFEKMSFKTKKVKKASRVPASASEDLIPNSQRYRNDGSQPETGKSGGRSLETWALLNKAGTTTVYINTGDVETNTPEVGTEITKINFKSKLDTGETVYNQQFNNLSNDGSVTQTFTELKRNQPLTIQASISKDGSKRNFVVKTQNTVKLLPDPKVTKITSLDEVMVGEPLRIDMEVRELNADTGSTGHCVIYLDGVEKYRSVDVWVDAGDSVICTFNHTFESAGEAVVKATFENSSPTDYELTNNEAEKTISVVQPQDSNFNNVSFNFSDNRYLNSHSHSGFFGYYYNYHENHDQSVYFRGGANQVNANLGVSHISVKEETSNSSLTASTDSMDNFHCSTFMNIKHCQWSHYSSNTYMAVVQYNGTMNIYFNRYGRKAVYHYEHQSYSYSSGYEDGNFLTINESDNSYKFNIVVELSDGSGLAFDKSFELTGYSNNYGDTTPCPKELGAGEEYCYRNGYKHSSKRAYFYGDPSQ